MATVETLLTAEEFGDMPDDGRVTELVRGRIVELSRPNFHHGYICGAIYDSLSEWTKPRKLGRIIMNDSGIITERDPDTLRGADVAFYSYARLPKEIRPKPYPGVAPEIVFEVRSPSERWPDLAIKVAEYLNIGVLVVCVLDPDSSTIRLFRTDQPEQTLGPDDELTFPECLPGFRVTVRSLFD